MFTCVEEQQGPQTRAVRHRQLSEWRSLAQVEQNEVDGKVMDEVVTIRDHIALEAARAHLSPHGLPSACCRAVSMTAIHDTRSCRS